MLTNLQEKYTEMKNTTVRETFTEFDNDGSGAIDRAELASLLVKMGVELNEEEIQMALVDLDLNGDGVIDFNEFCRWWFSGMKSYSFNKRSLLKVKDGVVKMGSVLNNPELCKFFKENTETITQSVSAAFNNPEDPSTTLSARVNILGPNYEKMLKKAKRFMEDKNIKRAHMDGRELLFFAQLEIETSNEAWKEFEPLARQFSEEKLTQLAEEKNVHVHIEKQGNIIISFLDQFNEDGGYLGDLKIPEEMREALSASSQYVQVDVELDTCPEFILDNDKPLLEHALEGFEISAKAVYNKHLAKAF